MTQERFRMTQERFRMTKTCHSDPELVEGEESHILISLQVGLVSDIRASFFTLFQPFNFFS